MNLLRHSQANERGSAIGEYVLLVGFIAVACLVALNVLGGSANEKYSAVASFVVSA